MDGRTPTTTMRIELHGGKLLIYHHVTSIDYNDDPSSMVKIYSGGQVLDAVPMGYIKSWRFERGRGPDRRQNGADTRPPPQPNRRQAGADRRRESVGP